jgi:hypothetical protein
MLGNGSSFTTITANNGAVGSWMLVTGTWNGTTASLYINGSLSTSTAFSGLTYGTSNLGIGADPGGGNSFSGLIDEVRIYNRALSAAEVAALYNAEH